MRARNWEDFVGVDQDGFIVQSDPQIDTSELDLGAIAISLGDIAATATPIPGNLDGVEEGDLIEFTLTAGVTYSFDLRGAVGGVVDPYLILLNSSLSTLVQDDDGGRGLGSLLTYTPTVTGTYYLYATAFDAITGNPAADDGDYTINVWTREADVPGTSSVVASLATAAPLGLGTYYGNIDVAGDFDYFSVNVVAGQYYTFTFAGGAASNAELSTPGNAVATLGLYRPDGSLIGSNLGFESSVGYFAQASGTIYVRAAGFSTTTGGYTLDAVQVDLSTRDPLESLNWDRAANIDTVLVDGVPTAYVYFGAAGETFGEPGLVAVGWTQAQIDAVMTALQTDYTPITGINYVRTTDITQAEFRLQTTPSGNFGAYFYPQDPVYGTQEGIGVFNLASGGFGTLPQSLERGGFSYAVILHEFGHAHGVAHPHDTGGGSEVMLGVSGATGSLGVFNLNQGVYTVMSYNDAWQLHPDGRSAFTVAGIDNGWSATLGAFDIAVLQARYGQHAHNSGDTVYALTDVADDAFYQTIWDTGGIDTISYGGTFNAQIDLTAATLDYTATGGGVLSFLYNPQPLAANSLLVRGGYTIANDVVIENASGGSGNDVLIGNEVANTLTGNGGNDTLMGRAGNDLLVAGAGNDVVTGGDGLDVIQLGDGNDIFVAEIGTTESVLKTGTMSVDIITDFDLLGDDLIDLSGLDQSFQFRGTNANRNVGDLTYKTYTSVNGAENALGIDIDGNPGASNISGPVTVVYGNIDGGAADFAIILLNTSSVTASDFIFSDAAADAAYSANQISTEYRAFEDSQTRAMGDFYFA